MPCAMAVIDEMHGATVGRAIRGVVGACLEMPDVELGWDAVVEFEAFVVDEEQPAGHATPMRAPSSTLEPFMLCIVLAGTSLDSNGSEGQYRQSLRPSTSLGEEWAVRCPLSPFMKGRGRVKRVLRLFVPEGWASS